MSGQWTTRSKSIKKGSVRASSAFSAKGHGSSAGGGGDDEGKGGAGVSHGELQKGFLSSFFSNLFLPLSLSLACLLFFLLTPFGLPSPTQIYNPPTKSTGTWDWSPAGGGLLRARSSCPTRPLTSLGSWSRCWVHCGQDALLPMSSRSLRCRGSVRSFSGGFAELFGGGAFSSFEKEISFFSLSANLFLPLFFFLLSPAAFLPSNFPAQ